MTQIRLPAFGRFTVKRLGPTGRRLLTVIGGSTMNVPEPYSRETLLRSDGANHVGPVVDSPE